MYAIYSNIFNWHNSIKLYPDETTVNKIIYEHAITQESVSSDCKTCTDWDNAKTIPIGLKRVLEL